MLKYLQNKPVIGIIAVCVVICSAMIRPADAGFGGAGGVMAPTRIQQGDYERRPQGRQPVNRQQQAQQAKFVVESKKQEAEQARQIAQGEADAAVIAAQGEADARLIEAEAEAAALELINAAIQGKPDLLTYQYISKLGPEIDVMLLPNDSPFLFPLPDLGTGQ